MGYTLTIPNYHAWQHILLNSSLYGFLLSLVVVSTKIGELLTPDRLYSRFHSRSWRWIWLTLLILGFVILQNHVRGHIPKPTTYDELAYVLSAETFVQGRWSMPSPPGWEHFETIHVTLSPTYHAKYQPGMGLVLALGQYFFHHPYYGVILVLMLASVSLDEMVRAWLPSHWSFLASTVGAITLADIWNTYYMGGPLAVLAGSLLLLTLRRALDQTVSWHHGFMLGVSFAVFFWSRPFEGAVLSLGVCAYGFLVLMYHRRWFVLFRLLPGVILVGVLMVFLQADYNKACTGSSWNMPYLEHERQYGLCPLFLWQNIRNELPAYRHVELARFHQTVLRWYEQQRVGKDWLDILCFKLGVVWIFFFPVLWLAVWYSLPELWQEQWSRALLFIFLYFVLSLLSITWLFHHYVAPALPLMCILVIQGLRVLSRGRAFGQPAGKYGVTYLVITFMVVMLVKPGYAAKEKLFPGVEVRLELEEQLVARGGQHIVVVSYSPDQPHGQEWVYNSALIDKQQVIWARSMTVEKDSELLKLYPNRQAWRLFIDKTRIDLKANK